MVKNFNLIASVLLLVGAGLTLAGCAKQLTKQSQVKLDPLSPTITLTETQSKTVKKHQSSQIERSSVPKTLKDFEPIEGNKVILHTNKGDITIKLYREQAPTTTANFLHLVQSQFYDGVIFHRVIDDFMAQTGDPLTKDETQQARWGTGGPGYTIVDEFKPELKHDRAGVVSMANVGQPNTGGSQFFITFTATPWLDGKHTVFGEVISGMAVVNQLEVGDKIQSAQISP